MRVFWKKYGIWIEMVLLILLLALLIYDRFWEGESEESWRVVIRWLQFIFFLILFFERLVKSVKANTKE
jgi:hypothetical protein